MQCLSLFFFPLMSHLGVHIVAQKAYLFFLKLHYISFFGGTIHGFHQDYVDGYFGCFYFFVITSCASWVSSYVSHFLHVQVYLEDEVSKME